MSATVGEATSVHGMNPQFLIEKIVRTRIYDAIYWKEHCFALTAETVIDKAVNLHCIGGSYGNQRPTDFLCLILKMLQLQPEKPIVRLYLMNEEHKYLTALAALYLRLTFSSLECYTHLEPLLMDKRKLRIRLPDGKYSLTYMDEFADNLLRQDRVCDIILPHINRRSVHVDLKELEIRVSPLEEDLEMMDEEEGEVAAPIEESEDEKEEEAEEEVKVQIDDEEEGLIRRRREEEETAEVWVEKTVEVDRDGVETGSGTGVETETGVDRNRDKEETDRVEIEIWTGTGNETETGTLTSVVKAVR
ncbi:PRP38 family-domain-containing protein [Chytridium lagenaria]|nr:PRP38 family-domain-containing protein [Chytridium lagenaria]